ncbi:MAG: SRPBCC family protein [Nitrososphaerota archaeon]|nr:SRPBCC family protein [Nitrososphaerota archaeon]
MINAPVNRVWEIVSDTDNDQKYWSGLKSVSNVRKSDTVVERRVTVGFIGRDSLQIIKLNPKESIKLAMKSGPLMGSRDLELIPSRNKKSTKVLVFWNFKFSGVPSFARNFVRGQIESVTEEALRKIAMTAENSAVRKVIRSEVGVK